jgi:hypothetical protein
LKDSRYLDELEDLIYSFNANDPLIITGDLNMNLMYKDNNKLASFLTNNNLINYIDKPTRIATVYHENTNTRTTSETLIDVCIHNNDLINDFDVMGCPFSDHCFVLIKLKISTEKQQKKSIIGRNLTRGVLSLISDAFDPEVFSKYNDMLTTNDKWNYIKNGLLSLIDEIAPEQNITIISGEQFPWIDDDLRYIQHLRDENFKKWKITNLVEDYLMYKNFRTLYDKNYNTNLINYFQTKTPKDFKESKKFWKFYSTFMSVKSDKSGNQSIKCIKYDETLAEDPISIGNLFNSFFTSLSSNSTANIDECIDYSKNHFNDIKDKLNVEQNSFKFHKISQHEVETLINDLDNTTGAGISSIPVKVLKQLNLKISSLITNLFNECIETKEIPSDWKTAVVTPLYKKSGSFDDLNNYRGISVLPPIGKIFEKIIANQINEHLAKNKLLFNGQYGFRSNHSCEAALHEILSDMNRILSERKIGIFFFIDFRKAFDLIPTDILLFKLKFGYGFDDDSIRLLSDYFKNRAQYVKIGSILSTICEVLLGVPQGSVLGQLLFLLFINDLSYFLKDFLTILFPDDTSLGLAILITMIF